MPHAEIKYSNNLSLDVKGMFSVIEQTINNHDKDSGECKCRAYPCELYQYSHVLIDISMLPKSHRDEHFTQQLMKELETELKRQIESPRVCRRLKLLRELADENTT